MDMSKLKEFLKTTHIDIAVLTIPKLVTGNVANEIVKLGIKGIWNFSAMDLKVPDDVVVENVHLSDSIMVLGYKIKNN